MNKYINIFIDKEYPNFLDKYMTTNTLTRLKHITQFCGCDYTKLYSPLFKYTRFDHSLVVAHMTWHFTHDKKETIVALLHDIGTPCFAHCIDYVFGDYINQESLEKSLIEIINKDKQIQKYLKEDNISIEDLNNYTNFHVLESKSPKLCTDRLDGVIHTCYIWLHTHSIKEIKEVYNNITVLKNEESNFEIGFNDIKIAEKFVTMVYNYAKEFQGNTDKYVMKYISELVKISVKRKLITLEDLYMKKEEELCSIFNENFSSWKKFKEARNLIRSNKEPKDKFYISFETKRRNTIPLVKTINGNKRINEVSEDAKNKYDEINQYKDSTYAYIEEISRI
ncbi:MAG: hypothetical protein HFE04_02745 [Bacilli bacterium]|nr:hypothetical protein [Bacilli bacterium]